MIAIQPKTAINSQTKSKISNVPFIKFICSTSNRTIIVTAAVIYIFFTIGFSFSTEISIAAVNENAHAASEKLYFRK